MFDNRQFTLIEDGELNELRLKASWADEYFKAITAAAELLYPDIEIWADTGSGYSVSLIQLEQMKNDLFKRNKKTSLRSFFHLLDRVFRR